MNKTRRDSPAKGHQGHDRAYSQDATSNPDACGGGDIEEERRNLTVGLSRRGMPSQNALFQVEKNCKEMADTSRQHKKVPDAVKMSDSSIQQIETYSRGIEQAT